MKCSTSKDIVHRTSNIVHRKIQLFTCACIIIACILVLHGCKKPNSDSISPVNPGTPGTPVNTTVDTISNHLRFSNATKKQGSIPKGPAGSSLKISFKDTLYLVDEVPRAIKFLHEDTTKNVAGIYVQVHTAGNGGIASHYYDVPEVSEMEDSDTVSVILIGIDPTGLEAPQTFDITITPYDKNKQPVAEDTRPAKLEKPKKGPNSNVDACGLVLPPGERWEWDFSLLDSRLRPGEFQFTNQPGKVFSSQGQDIEGSCCDGNSTYPEYCLGDPLGQKTNTLHFATYYQINFENFIFFSGGNFFRQTMEDSPIPIPAESNFCGNGAGKVKQSLKHTTYEGDWTIEPTIFPPNLSTVFKKDSLSLRLRSTGGTGTGYGNPGGAIHQLDCNMMILVQLDKEGGGRHLVKYYYRFKVSDLRWYHYA